MITVGSLFSGIGGIELGLERTGGFRTIWNCEIDAYASAVLKKHWPEVPNLGDITKVNWDGIEKPDMLCGGFPCQDISIAGKGKGIKEGKRSGLWSEYARAIRELRPSLALIENVPMLARRGLNIVLTNLAEMGYDAEWFTLSAQEVGAWHKRERIFIIAYPDSSRCYGVASDGGESQTQIPISEGGRNLEENDEKQYRRLARAGENGSDVPNTVGNRLNGGLRPNRENEDRLQEHKDSQQPILRGEIAGRDKIRREETYWATEPDVGRVANGISSQVDRIKCLGNAVVPQVAEVIGKMILEASRGSQKEEAKK